MLVLRKIPEAQSEIPKVGSSTLFLDEEGNIKIRELDGSIHGPGGDSIQREDVIASSADSGFVSPWFSSFPFAERFSVTLNQPTGGVNARVLLEGSSEEDANEGNSVGYWDIPTSNVGVEDVSPPIFSQYKYLRFRVLESGTGTLTLIRGA